MILSASIRISLVTCPSLSNPSNGMINCSLGDDKVPSYEDTCNFTCDTGYELTGSETRTCQSNGTWSGSIAMCISGEYNFCLIILLLMLLLLPMHDFHKINKELYFTNTLITISYVYEYYKSLQVV